LPSLVDLNNEGELKMSKDDIFEVVKSNIVEILPGIPKDDIKIEERLKDLGANSIDRMDIVIKTMEIVGVKVPLVELGLVSNIQGLVNVLHEKKMALV
jgi:polyketide biosynthesis acyl carrier protein